MSYDSWKTTDPRDKMDVPQDGSGFAYVASHEDDPDGEYQCLSCGAVGDWDIMRNRDDGEEYRVCVSCGNYEIA
jgi:hypothetical protein